MPVRPFYMGSEGSGGDLYGDREYVTDPERNGQKDETKNNLILESIHQFRVFFS